MRTFKPLLLVLSALGIFAASLAYAQIPSAVSSNEVTQRASAAKLSVSFPIAELGNCRSKDECKAYCDDAAHRDVCLSFAKKHRLISEEEAASAKLAMDVEKTGGPGGCTSQESCKAYCEDSAHMEECVSFAKKRGFLKGEELKRAEKMLELVKKGVTRPGNCSTQAQCEAYCNAPAHARECIAFAKQAGFMKEEEADRILKMQEAMEQGQTPGACTSKDACETYCHDQAHAEECIAFAEKHGFADREDIERFKKTGGKGPGGCTGKEACEAFCKEPANQQACLDFAQEHGFVKKGDVQNIKEAVNRMRAGLENAPPEVRSCLEEMLGGDILNRINAHDDSFVPDPEIGMKMRDCFEKNKGSFKAKFTGDLLEKPELAACIKGEVGEEAWKAMQSGQPPADPEMGMKIKGCFEKHMGAEQGFGGPEGGMMGGEHRGQGPMADDRSRLMRCIAEKLGVNLGEGENMSQLTQNPKYSEAHDACARQMGGGPQGAQGQGGPMGNEEGMKMRACVAEKAGLSGDSLNDMSKLANTDVQKAVEACISTLHFDKPQMLGRPAEDRQGPGPGMQNYQNQDSFNQGQSGGPDMHRCVAEKLGMGPEALEALKAKDNPAFMAAVKACQGGGQNQEVNPMMRRQMPQGVPQGGTPLGGPGSGQSVSPEIRNCVIAQLGAETALKMEQGANPAGDPAYQTAIHACYEKMGAREQRSGTQGQSMPGMSGQGGTAGGFMGDSNHLQNVQTPGMTEADIRSQIETQRRMEIQKTMMESSGGQMMQGDFHQDVRPMPAPIPAGTGDMMKMGTGEAPAGTFQQTMPMMQQQPMPTQEQHMAPPPTGNTTISPTGPQTRLERLLASLPFVQLFMGVFQR